MENKLNSKKIYLVASIPILIMGYLYIFTLAFEWLRAPSDMKVFGGAVLLCLIVVTLISIVKFFKTKCV